MKKKLFPAIGFVTIMLLNCGNDDSSKEKKQNSIYPVSMEGFDRLKLNMTKAEVEKLLKTTITFKHIKVDGGFSDTVAAKYKNEDIILYFDEVSDETIGELRGMETKSSSFKTASGMSAGSDKLAVIDAYASHTKYVAPEYEEYPVRSATKSVVAVMDTVQTSALVFHIINRKVSSLELRSYYEFY